MRVTIVDDDAYNREEIEKDVLSKFPDARCVSYECMFDAYTGGKPCDVLIVDLSSVEGGIMGVEHAYSPICAFIEDHPGATVLINSAVAHQTSEYVKERILECISTARVRIVTWPWHDNLIPELQEAAGE